MISVLSYSGKGPMSKLIKWQTRSKYSHSAIMISNGFSTLMFESNPPEVTQLLGEPAIVRAESAVSILHPTVEVDEDRMFRWLTKQVGKKYDKTMVVRFVTRKQETRKSREKWFCSELVYAAFKHVGVDLFRDTEPWEVSPGMLARSPLLR
jgi:uncharacterized protein YycO